MKRRAFRQANALPDDRPVDERAETLPELFHDLTGVAGPGVHPARQNPRDRELRVEAPFHQRDHLQKLHHAGKWQHVGFHRDQHFARRGQRVHRESAERRRTIEKHIVPLALGERFELALEDALRSFAHQCLVDPHEPRERRAERARPEWADETPGE